MVDDDLTLTIRGGRPIYGNVSLSGDTASSIFLILYGLFLHPSVEVRNVPRSNALLKFLGILEELNIKVKWLGVNSVLVNNLGVTNDISNMELDGELEEGFVITLLPFVLAKTRACVIHGSLQREAKFYRELGFDMEVSDGKVTIKTPVGFYTKKTVDMRNSRWSLITSRLLLQMIVPTLEVIFDRNDARFISYSRDSEPTKEIPKFTACHNLNEFSFFTSLGAISSDEVTIKGFHLEDSLRYLMALSELGVKYEVSKDTMHIWNDGYKFKDDYDWSGLPLDEIGYLIILVTVESQKAVRVIVRSHPLMEYLVKELNIIGCRLQYAQGDEHAVISIKHADISPTKTSLSGDEVSGIFLFSAVYAQGTSVLSNAGNIVQYMPSLIENMNDLHVDIRS